MSWWRLPLRRDPPAPRGRHHVGAFEATSGELTENLVGMLQAYVPPAANPVASSVPGNAAPPPAPVVPDEGTVILGFADGASEVLGPQDARSRPFQALVRELLRERA